MLSCCLNYNDYEQGTTEIIARQLKNKTEILETNN